ncbi:predicted protein [Candida tropicalis MYA-3404]|uniref:Spindle pole body-associated protein Vik1/Cik1 microtubule binding domain-containing protein n=1 Tax=Candida tropicalis (strain ATCC MYA-3404 / T1) TaxID=294747 RepID=C5M866_CANTT|nr:predicted protein [Candida tropicalis MYA-3404]EER33770.1 predicted protein [Candida tropicalis MYA-3404]KAG4407618.1 hypothetical protein JTP64_003153 [Candida tropicalis]
MALDNIKSPSPSREETSNNKRPLSEISPNIPRTSKTIGFKKRRNSLGFEMASIPSNFKSKIPQLSNSLGSSSGSLGGSSSGSSAGSTSSSISIPQGILSIQERLKRKSTIRSNFKNVQSVVTSSTSQISELQEEYYSLNESYKRQAQFLENQEIELNKLKRIFKNTYYKIEKISNLINEKQIHLEFIEEDIVSFIEQEEKLINLKIKEYEMKLNSQFKELEFEMMNELEDAKKFDFTDLIENVESLTRKRDVVKNEIEELKEKVNERLNEETKMFETELANKIEPLVEQKKTIQSELDDKKKELEKISMEHYQQESTLVEKQTDIDVVKHEISRIEQIMNNFQATKKSLESDLDKVDQELSSIMTKDSEEQKEYDIIHSEYSILRNKISKHDHQRRVLENSIMEYEGKFRVYGIGTDVNLFNKSFTVNNPSSFIIEEFQCLVKSVLKNRNVCIINNYLPGGSIVINSFENFKQQNSIYQCISIKDDDICDLLNSNMSVDTLFQHQKMIIDDFDQFKQVVEDLDSTISEELAIHIISNEKTKFIVVDCSRVDIDKQKNILSRFIKSDIKGNDFLGCLLNWLYKNCTALFLYDAKDQESINLLNTINSIDIPS